MKLGLFADSYGCMSPKNLNLNPELSWYDLLRDHVDITNFSVGGASLYYAYKMFLENNHRFDKNIVLGSFPARVYVPNLSWHHVNYAITTNDIAWKNNGMFKEEIDAVKLYYKYIYNPGEELHYRPLIEKDILTYENTLYLSIPDTLHKVTLMERNVFNYSSGLVENMNAHMTNENNTVFFNSILRWLQCGEFQFNLQDYVLPNKEDFNKYYI